MTDFLRDHLSLIGLVLLWVALSHFFPPALFVAIPLSLIAMRGRELWPHMIMALLAILVLSDVNKIFLDMRSFKDAKNLAVLTLAFFLVREGDRFAPQSGIFRLFLPFFAYSVFPLVFSNDLGTAIMKTISFALMYLLVPNYVLYNYRQHGWAFFRNLVFFIMAILIASFLLRYIAPKMAFVGGRFSGLFGNPNGLAIFCFLSMVLVGVLTNIKQDLFTWREKLFISGTILYFIVISGSRSALVSYLIFLVFHRFFAFSPFIGFVALVALFGLVETIGRNLQTIVLMLGLEEYFRLHTLDDGSGRYFAWSFAWEKVQDYLVFGGGFANDEYIMRRNYDYLERMGHQGGVHNSYLSMWFNVGIVGLFIYFRSFILLFIKAAKLLPISTAAMFSVLFSVMYESWLVGSLNPYTILLLMIMTVTTEEEIVLWRTQGVQAREAAVGGDAPPPTAAPLPLPQGA